MKKRKFRLICALMLVVTLLCLSVPFACAEDSGYYIKDMKVEVVADDAREYHVTETITAHFNEERHGIIRTIPTSSSTEMYHVTDISVSGAPYQVDEYGNVEIRIGDADTTVIGDQQYVIRYTLKHYADYDDQADYLYLNVLGTSWDTHIDHFEAVVTYPEQAHLQEVTYTGGVYGEEDADYFVASQEGNTFHIESTRQIPEGNGITLNAKFAQGAFPLVPEYEFPYLVLNSDTKVEVDSEKIYYISRSYTFDMKEGGNVVRIELVDDPEEKLIASSIDSPDGNAFLSTDGESVYLSSSATGICSFTVNYTVRPALDTPLSFWLVDPTLETVYSDVSAVVTTPFPIRGYHIQFGREGDPDDGSRYTVRSDGMSVEFQSNGEIKTAEKAVLGLDVDQSLFYRPVDWRLLLSVGISVGILAVVVLLFLFFGRDKKLVIPVEFYPPKELNSAEVGFIINHTANTEDITSLIFYWAGHGHLKITSYEDGGFLLTKQSELDIGHQPYEKEMFRALFAKGDGITVCDSDLKEKFYDQINKTKLQVSRSFRKERALYDHLAAGMQALGIFLSVLPLFIFAVLSCQVSYESIFGGLIGAMVAAVGLLFNFVVFCLFSRQYYKVGKGGMLAYSMIVLVLFAISISLSMLFLVMGSDTNWLFALFTLIASYAGAVISVFIKKRSVYGQRSLERVLGFRHFIEVAEKDRLERLLEQDPEYFYRTLPFAQVLGVTDLWTDKFKDIAMQPPSWYDGTDVYHPYFIYTLSHTMSQMSREVSQMPASSGSGGGFSGGGGGFGGGGFSGGGSGGGGGSSW